jgi:cation diffusion facilitator CzcD-associated flavoprotein CzcO
LIEVTKLVHFIRSPTWIAPPQTERLGAGKDGKFLASIQMNGDKFTEEQIKIFKHSPETYMRFVKAVEEVVNSKFKIASPLNSSNHQATCANIGSLSQLINGSNEAEQVLQFFSSYMTTALRNDEGLMKILIPKFPVGCRRITPGVGYLPALHEENVQVVTDRIVEILPEGIKIRSGEVIDVDAIVCATGFDVSFQPRFPIIGRDGNLQDIWKKNLPKAYMSCAVPGMPNYFSKIAHSHNKFDTFYCCRRGSHDYSLTMFI